MDSTGDASWIAVLQGESPSLTAFLTMITRDRDVADDLTQETFLEAWRCRDRFDKQSDLGRWLRGIARMIVLRHRRGVFRRPVTSLTADIIEKLDESWSRTWKAAAVHDDAEALRQCLEELPDDERHCLREHYERDEPLRRVAERLGKSEDAVKMLFLRLRKKLFTCVEKRIKAEAHS